MKLSELIQQVGDENVKVQNLEQSCVSARYSGKRNATDITFRTDEPFLTADSKVALVVWIPKDKLRPRQNNDSATGGSHNA